MADLDASRHLMVLPTLACPARCRYCFGPNTAGPTMSPQTLAALIAWQRQAGDGTALSVTFHGAEPLAAGAAFYRRALPGVHDGLAPRQARFAVQSNLWLLTDELCELFAEHGVALGTSLDGPEGINDAQRGRGYFRKTMAGIERARSHGLSVGCVCTFTAQSARHASEVFDFFVQEELDFSFHAAAPPVGHPGGDYVLDPEAHGQLLRDMLERYLAAEPGIRIGTLDSMCRGVAAGHGAVCTFTDCLGQYLTVDPAGWIYPCQRLAGTPAYRVGNVHALPCPSDMAAAPAWQAFQRRQDRVAAACDGCAHLPYCRGGCPYNVLAVNDGRLDGDPRDPHCPAYRQMFAAISDRAVDEVFSEKNLASVVSHGTDRHGLLHEGRLLRIMRGSPHPREATRRARQTVAAVALAVSPTPKHALRRLDQAGVITDPDAALVSLQTLRRDLDARHRRLNAYLHVTSGCDLACTHCYAAADTPTNASTMPVGAVGRLIRQAAKTGFAKTVITGGEPLTHPRRDDLLETLAALRQRIRPMQLVVRTNLAGRLEPSLTHRLLAAADEIVVSVDGDRESHDTQRGAGTYTRTVANLRQLTERAREVAGTPGILPAARAAITATLSPERITGASGSAVRALGDELGVPVRFKTVLPLGRARSLELQPAFHTSLDEDHDALTHSASPAASCGLGMTLSVAPDGTCYPCYALTSPRHSLGNALDDGLPAVLARNDTYRQVTVDSTRRCRACSLRYLCGGYCRAWATSDDPNAPPPDCRALRHRAEGLLSAALNALAVDRIAWEAAGLPLQGESAHRAGLPPEE